KGMTVTQFWQDILQTTGENIIWILLLILPVGILAMFGKGYFSFERGNMFTFGIYLFAAIVLQLGAVGLVHTGEQGQHSAYELYYDQHFPLLATENLGLLTSMRLDLQRTVTNWSPTLTAPPTFDEPDEPVDTHPEDDDEQVEEEVIDQTMDIDFDSLMEQ